MTPDDDKQIDLDPSEWSRDRGSDTPRSGGKLGDIIAAAILFPIAFYVAKHHNDWVCDYLGLFCS